ncbi:MAG: ATP-binding protein [Kiloniellaceae bacterium]
MITRDPNRRSSARARCFPLFPGRPAGDGTLELVGPSMNENSDIPFQVKASGTDRRSSVAADATSRPDSPESPSVRSIHSLAVQVPLLLVVALSLVVAVGAWGLRTIVLRSFERLEVANAELDLRRFANAIDHEVALLDDQLSDAIVRRSRMSDVERLDVIPLGTSPAAHRSPEVACIFDRQGALVSTDSHDPAGDLLQMINPTDFCALTEDDPAMAQRLIREPAAGLYDAEGTFFIVAARPHPPRPGADVAGDVLLFARLLTTDELDAIAARMKISIDFWSMDTPNMDVLEAAAGAALSLGAPIIVNRRSEDVLQVYWAFQDAWGNPAFLARANVFRDLRVIGDETVILSALAMGGVGVATILLSLFLVRSLMVKRLSRLTGRVLAMRREGVSGARLKVDEFAGKRHDEIGLLAEEFDKLLGELSTTTDQLADVSYRAGRAEVTEGSLHNIGNALNSLLASADSARIKIEADSTSNVARATQELAAGTNLDERQSKLARYAALASEEANRRLDGLKSDVERVILHIGRIEDILESQRRLGSDQDLAVVCDLEALLENAVGALPISADRDPTLHLHDSVRSQPPIVCVRAVILQVFSNLLLNAIEAIERKGVPGGRIDISAETVEVDGASIVDICFTDNGVGLEPPDLVTIFQRHFTTKTARGHGIGLHWCANVVSSMGGHLYARSDGFGQGASLHLLLPITQNQS